VFVPPAFAQTDRDTLFALIEQHSFGLLVSNHPGGPVATHLPLLLDRAAGPHGTLVGHLARANPQWRDLDGQPVTAVFSGPHAYVSPSWYEADNVVPTWNYVAVHATGTFRVVESPAAVAAVLAASVATYERAMPTPWELDPTTPYFAKLVGGIVAFRVPIDRLEGTWKLSQNHPPGRRAKVAAALAASADPAAREVARLMREGAG
jgi:transcriptional regulator